MRKDARIGLFFGHTISNKLSLVLFVIKIVDKQAVVPGTSRNIARWLIIGVARLIATAHDGILLGYFGLIVCAAPHIVSRFVVLNLVDFDRLATG